MISDGTYNAFIVDVEEAPGAATPPALVLDLTILSGEHKGEVVTVTAAGLGTSAIALLGMPATLTVTDGTPSVRVDD